MTALGDWFRRTFGGAAAEQVANPAAAQIPVAAIGDPVGTYVLSPAALLQCWPTCQRPVEHAAGITRAWAKWGITTAAARCIFMAQCGHESGDGNKLREVLYYTSAERLLGVHGARACRTPEAKAAMNAWRRGQPLPPIAVREATEILRNEKALGDRVYSNLLGNGPDDPNRLGDDGWLFAGTGDTQLTGRWIFTELGRKLGMSAEQAVAYAQSPEGGAHATGFYWEKLGITPRANAGDFVGVVLMTAGKMAYRRPAEPLGMTKAVSDLIAYESDRLPRYRRCQPVFGAPLL